MVYDIPTCPNTCIVFVYSLPFSFTPLLVRRFSRALSGTGMGLVFYFKYIYIILIKMTGGNTVREERVVWDCPSRLIMVLLSFINLIVLNLIFWGWHHLQKGMDCPILAYMMVWTYLKVGIALSVPNPQKNMGIKQMWRWQYLAFCLAGCGKKRLCHEYHGIIISD